MPNPSTRGRASQHFDRMVVSVGLEPTLPEGNQALNLAGLPFPHETLAALRGFDPPPSP